MEPIMDYLEIGKFPNYLKKAKNLRELLCLFQGDLFKQAYAKPLSKCFTKETIDLVLPKSMRKIVDHMLGVGFQ